ncbi:MAG: hypothetical protein M0R03_20620 [Novosphingobium sp.]|nr:hypothetical protein [Novosphingobium sp.]
MTKVYVIVNYHKSIVEVTSQTIVQKNYIKLLSDIGYDVVVLYPKWGDEINKVLEAKNYVCLDIDGYTNRSILPYEYIKFLKKEKLNDVIIYTFQSDNAIDLVTELSNPPYVFPKIINHFIAGDEYEPNNPKNLKRIIGFSLPTIYNSDYAKAMNEKKMFKAGISPFEFFAKSKHFIANLGIPFSSINRVKSTEKNEKFTFLFPGNSLMSFKNFDVFIKIFDKLYETGRKFEVKLFLLNKDFGKTGLDRPYISLNKTLPREEFFKEASKCHAFLSTSKGETYGLAYWELCEAGVLGLFFNKPWVKKIGNVDDYFVFNNVEEGVSKAAILMDRYEEYQNLFSKWWNENRERFEDVKCDEEYKKNVQELITNLLNV